MPIRHCQKCGLKVLIDESQTAANPFYCQRCAVSNTSGSEASVSSPPPPETPPEGVPRQETASMAKPALDSRANRGGPVKVLCPYCKASFSGRLPAKPAKGACPVCQKELVLLPDGKIRPATNFDLVKWQKEQEMLRYGGQEAGTAEQAKAVQRALEGATDDGSGQAGGEVPAADPLADAMANLPPSPGDVTMMPTPAGVGSETMLDMGRPDVTRAAELPAMPTGRGGGVDPFGGLGGETMLDMGRGDAPPAEAPPQENPMAEQSEQPPPPAEEPPPQPSYDAPPVSADDPTVLRSTTAATVPIPESAKAKKKKERTVRRVQPVPGPGRGTGKAVLAALLLLLPIGAAIAAFFVKGQAKFDEALDRIGGIATRGFREVEERMGGAAPAQAPVPPPKKESVVPPPPPQPVGAQAELGEQIQKEWTEIQGMTRKIADFSRNPTEAEKKAKAELEVRLVAAQKRYDGLQASYKAKYGAEIKPK